MSSTINTEVKPPAQNRWKGLKQAQLPSCLVTDGILNLPNDALTVYPVLLHIHRNKMAALSPADRQKQYLAHVKVSLSAISRYTGLSKNSIVSGTKALVEHGFIRTDHPRKEE